MAITQGVCKSWKVEVLDGVHLAADVYKIALYVAAAVLNKSTTVYTSDGEVANSGTYVAGGLALSGRAVSLDGDSAILDFADPLWTSATIAARGALIYNSTRGNKAVAVIDFGSDIRSTNGNFNVTLPAATATTALMVLT